MDSDNKIYELEVFKNNYLYVLDLFNSYVNFVNVVNSMEFEVLNKSYNKYSYINKDILVDLLKKNVSLGKIHIPQSFYKCENNIDLIINNIIDYYYIYLNKFKNSKELSIEYISSFLTEKNKLKNNKDNILFNNKNKKISKFKKFFFKYTKLYKNNLKLYENKINALNSNINECLYNIKDSSLCLNFLNSLPDDFYNYLQKIQCEKEIVDLFLKSHIFDIKEYKDIKNIEEFYILEINKVLKDIKIPSGNLVLKVSKLNEIVINLEELFVCFGLEINNCNFISYDMYINDEFINKVDDVFGENVKSLTF